MFERTGYLMNPATLGPIPVTNPVSASRRSQSSESSRTAGVFRSFLACAVAFAVAALTSATQAWAAPSPLVTTAHTTVELLSDRQEIKPGEPFWVGFLFRMKPGWHIYFENPGDSGLAPRVSWEGDSPRTLGPINWPAPKLLPLEPLVNYGYTDEVLLPIQARIEPSAANKETVELVGQLSWLICEENCIPEKGLFSLTLNINPRGSSPSASADLFEKVLTAMPRELTPEEPFRISQSAETLLLELPDFVGEQSAPYFFASQRGITSSSAPQLLLTGSGRKMLQMKKAPSFSSFRGPVPGILEVRHSDGSVHSYAMSGTPDTVAVSEPVKPAALPSPMAEEQSTSLVVLIGLALLGGMILNLMPCVLPVLSLKVLSLVDHACDSRRRKLLLAGCYAGGTVFSLVALAGILLLLRTGGAQIGWGFQLQYPPVVGLLALFFFVVGLSFLGFFDVGGRLAHHACQLDKREGPGGAFLSGLLATIVATPCTAPFMGTAVGVALLRPWYEALTIFAALGFGIALPYVLLVLFPGLQRFLPRPGEWMNTLKQLLAFPLFATSIWLLWILSVQRGGPGVILVLLSALIAFFGVWIGKSALKLQKCSIRRTFWQAVATLITVAGLLIIPLPDLLSMQRGEQRAADGAVTDAHGLVWQPYSAELLTTLREQGTPIYLDFTAAWCITCQVNKTVVFSDMRVQDLIRSKKIQLVRADWTNQDPAITEALASYGRASVPLNVVYQPGSSTAPALLPTVLTPQTVLDALLAE